MPFLVSNVLKLAVPLDGGGVLFAIPSSVVRVARAPFLRTIQASLTIYRIRSHLLAVIIGAAPPLALGLTAYRLPRLIFRWLEGLLTVAATPLDHTRGCRTCEESISGGDLETAVECVLRPGRWLVSLTTKTGGIAVVLSRH